MADVRVDEPAVMGEFAAICRRLAAVTGLVNPQTWQGGSAGHFADALNGVSSSLAAMMDGICRDVSAINKHPFGPPPTPPKTSGFFATPVRAIDVGRMRALERALYAAASALPGHGRRLRGLLAAAGGHAGTKACDNAAAWCAQQAKTARWRVEYALASDRISPAFAPLGVTGGFGRGGAGMVAIPDVDRVGAAEMRQLGALEGKVYTDAVAQRGPSFQTTMRQLCTDLCEHARDGDYLKGFFGAIPPGSAGKLPYQLHQQHHDGKTVLDATDKQIIAGFGTALAALSRRASDVARRAMGPIGQDMPGQGLLVKLSDGKWDSQLLAELGKVALLWRQQWHSYEFQWMAREGEVSMVKNGAPPARGDWPYGDHHWFDDWGLGMNDLDGIRALDPALNVLAKIQQTGDDKVARAIAGAELPHSIARTHEPIPLSYTKGGSGTFVSLLVAADWLDGGKAAGDVIKLATTTSRGDNDAGKESARIAHDVMQATAWWNREGRPRVRDFFGTQWNLLNAPIGNGEADPGFSLTSDFDLGTGLKQGLFAMAKAYQPSIANADVHTEVSDSFFDKATGQRNAHIGGRDIQAFLRTFTSDDKMRASLAVAAQEYELKDMAWWLRNGRPEGHLRSWGQLEGNLVQANVDETIGDAMRKDAAAADMVATLKQARDIVSKTVPWDKVPGADVLIERPTDQLLDGLKTQHSATAQNQVQELGKDWGGKILDSLGQQLYGFYHEHYRDNRVPAEVRSLFDDKGRLKPGVDTNPIRVWLLDSEKQAGLNGKWALGEAEDGYNNNVNKPYAIGQ